MNPVVKAIYTLNGAVHLVVPPPKRVGSPYQTLAPWGTRCDEAAARSEGEAGKVAQLDLVPRHPQRTLFRSKHRPTRLRSPSASMLWWSSTEDRMAKKTRSASQTPRQEPNPYAPAYAARLARQVTEELSSGRPIQKKKRGAGKTPHPGATSR